MPKNQIKIKQCPVCGRQLSKVSRHLTIDEKHIVFYNQEKKIVLDNFGKYSASELKNKFNLFICCVTINQIFRTISSREERKILSAQRVSNSKKRQYDSGLITPHNKGKFTKKEKICQNCYNLFYVHPSKFLERKYCSINCAVIKSRGRHSPKKGKTKYTDESIKRASEKIKGRTYEQRYGVERARELKEVAGRYNRGKSYEELYGIERALYLKELRRKNMIGRIVTEEQRKTIGEKNKGKPGWSKGKTVNEDPRILAGPRNGMYGKKRPDRSLMNKQNDFSLEKNPNWQGGISFEPYTPDFNRKFKQSIKERDGCCLLCSLSLEDLKLLKRRVHIHHVNYIKIDTFPQNCVTLCVKCHGLTHFNRSYWITFFQSLLRDKYSYEYTQDQKIIIDFINKNG